MKRTFSTHWNSSKKPNKQRKFRFNAPKHIRSKFLNAHLSKDLREKYGLRAVRLRLGDKVRVMRGQFKKQEGKIEEVNTKSIKVFISKIEHTKRDGTKAKHPFDPSNLLIVELNKDDKMRLKRFKAESKKTVKTVKTEKKDKNG